VRDISAQYRQSLLGIPYPVFVFTGTLLWSILIDALNAPLQQVTANKALLAKINFPREALIVSGIYQTLFNAAIKLGILLLVLPVLGVHPGWGGLLIPVGLLSLVLTGTAVGLALTPLGVLYGDIGRGIPLILIERMSARGIRSARDGRTAGVLSRPHGSAPITALGV
jgi:lipopolysaccharide transport system permease protein